LPHACTRTHAQAHTNTSTHARAHARTHTHTQVLKLDTDERLLYVCNPVSGGRVQGLGFKKGLIGVE